MQSQGVTNSPVVSRIPSILASMLDMSKHDIHIALCSIFSHIMSKIVIEKVESVAYELIRIILYNHTTTESALELVESGLCYYNSNKQAVLVYPDNIVMKILEGDIEKLM